MNKNFLLFIPLFWLFGECLSGADPSITASSFHNNLAENRREEITIIDNHSVKVGLGPDQRSVSCTILDAVASIPSINGKTEPDVVYVNKEKVHHIRNGLYAWDGEGKYRVRLTTKYIREFGEIIIRVPSESAAAEKPDAPNNTKAKNSYYASLPENKRQEITIIDDFMVEVGLGPDLRSIQSITQDAIRSIPSINDEDYPEFVFVNGDPVFYIGNGLYSWDEDGSNPVRLTTSFIKKFGNIRVSVASPVPPEEPPISAPATMGKRVAKIPQVHQGIKAEESIPSSAAAAAKKDKGLALKGFRLARFGMAISQVKEAIQKDFKIAASSLKTSGPQKNILSISTPRLSDKGDEASVQYFFSTHGLAKVTVTWEPSENTDNLAVKLIEQFLNLRSLKMQSPTSNQKYLYYGKDSYGNAIRLSWAENSPHPRRSLILSYLELAK